MIKLQSIPLTERKKARRKLALLDVAVNLMRKKPLSEITVEELCQKTEISKGTFFTDFPRKVDLIFFYIRLWSVEAVWTARHEYCASAGLRLIEAIFTWTGRIFEDHPRLFSEIIALRAFHPQEFTRLSENSGVMVGVAERILRFPKKEGIETIPEGTFINIVRENLQLAMQQDELPQDTNLREATLAVLSSFYGIPLMLGDRSPKNLPQAYLKHLKLLWMGLRPEKTQSLSRKRTSGCKTS